MGDGPKKRAFIARRMAKQDGRCYWCDEVMVVVLGDPNKIPNAATIDHVIPIMRGGSNGSWNKVVCCRACNGLKGSIPPEDWAILISKGIASARSHIDAHKARMQAERRYIAWDERHV